MRRPGPATPVDPLLRARMQVAAGTEPSRDGLDGRARRALDLAERVGAPVGPALSAAQAAGDDLDELRRTVRVASAQARFVARGLVVLPVMLVPGLDLLAGMPLVAFYGTAPGRGVALVAGVLLLAGALVARAQVGGVLRRAEPDGEHAPDDEVADLLAAALRAGLPTSAALRAVAQQRPDRSLDLHRAALAVEQGRGPEVDAGRQHLRARRRGAPLAPALAVLAAADAVGAPAAEALGDLARRQRAEHRAHVAARAEQLPSRLTVPSVLLLLPATVLLVGAPIVAAGLAG